MSSNTMLGVPWVPHPYQKRAVQIMIRQGAAALLLDPGLGKTSCVLAAFKMLKKKGYVKKALIIAPLRPVYDVWPLEIEKWANFQGLTYSILHGKDKEWLATHSKHTDIFLINPEGLAWLIGEGFIKKLGVDMLVVDESTKFKNSTSIRFKLLKKILSKFKRRYILTGTVCPNGLLDLFGQFYILDGGNALGRYITHYRRQFFSQPNAQYEPYRWEPNSDAMSKIAERVSPLSLQLSAEDYLDMPDLYDVNMLVSLPAKAMKTYAQVEDEFISAIDDGLVIAKNAAAAGTKCRQIANGAVYLEGKEYSVLHDVKIAALAELIDELSGAPLLVMYEFQHDLDRLQKAFPEAHSIKGSGVKVSNTLMQFNAGQISVLFGHPASMGHGLNLQGACHHVCWFGIPWNYEHYDQAIARVYRQGQKSEMVFVYHIVAKGTLDNKILRVLEDKAERQEALLSIIT